MNPRILIVDDEPLMTEVLATVLAMELEVEISTANDPLQAWESFQSQPYQLVITDYLMPGLNGMQLIRKIREQGSSVPVMMLTGYYNDLGNDVDLHALGAFKLMEKPWKNVELIRQIQDFLNTPGD